MPTKSREWWVLSLSFLALGGKGCHIDYCYQDSDCVTFNESQCWITTCNPDGFCTYELPEGDCDDGRDCTIDDHCVDGECIGVSNCAAGQLCVGNVCQNAP